VGVRGPGTKVKNLRVHLGGGGKNSAREECEKCKSDEGQGKLEKLTGKAVLRRGAEGKNDEKGSEEGRRKG